jgi:hypothetical protein
MSPVLCFLSSRLPRLATVMDGVYVYGPHQFSCPLTGKASRC